MTVQTRGAEASNTMFELQKLEAKVAKHNGAGVVARLCGKSVKDGRAGHITSCKLLPASNGAKKRKLVVKLKLGDKFTKWVGWTDEVEVSRGEDCIMLFTPSEPPLLVF